MVLSGPTEPPFLDSILKPMVDFFVKHDPGMYRTLHMRVRMAPYVRISR